MDNARGGKGWWIFKKREIILHRFLGSYEWTTSESLDEANAFENP